jgi:hypothetical protein
MKKTFAIISIYLCIFISKNISAQIIIDEVKYNGKIGSSPIILTFLVPDHFYNYIHGNYYYTKYKKEIEFQGEDGVFEGSIKLLESFNGKNTGYFIFDNIDGIEFPKKIVGKWYNVDGSKSFDVALTSM